MAYTWKKKAPLIEWYVRDVSIDLTREHIKTFRGEVGKGQSGIYVLRKGEDVYYVGLASSLRQRITQHIVDKHRGRWDRFDLYAIRKGKVKYLKELETLLIRVSRPGGNARKKPDFVDAVKKTRQFKNALQQRITQMFAERSA